MDSESAAGSQPPADSQPRKRWRRWAKHAVTLFFFVAVAALLYMLLQDIEWREVGAALQGYRPAVLAAGVGIAALSYLVFASYDLVGRHYTSHGLGVGYVLPVAFTCYAFNLNFGAWLGGLAMRFRLYSRFGLKMGTVTSIVAMSLITNWLGYTLVAGTLFSLGLLELPESWWVESSQLRWIGFALLAVAPVYLLLCAYSPRREFSWRRFSVTLPSLGLATSQALLGMTNWGLMGALIYLLLPDGVNYATVLAILMVSSIAGAITHIPGGIGILEAVFLGLLQGRYPTVDLLAALIAYRGIYFLLPLAVAAVVYLALEKKATGLGKDSSTQSAGDASAGGENQ